jgi:hypothetical protein
MIKQGLYFEGTPNVVWNASGTGAVIVFPGTDITLSVTMDADKVRDLYEALHHALVVSRPAPDPHMSGPIAGAH